MSLPPGLSMRPLEGPLGRVLLILGSCAWHSAQHPHSALNAYAQLEPFPCSRPCSTCEALSAALLQKTLERRGRQPCERSLVVLEGEQGWRNFKSSELVNNVDTAPRL